MATLNPFDLLDDDAEDPSLLLAAVAQQQKLASVPAAVTKKGPAQQPKPAASLPSKPLPPSQAAREARNDSQRGGGRGGPRGEFRGRGRGRGGGFNRDSADGENTFGGSNGFSGGYGGYRASNDGESGKLSERKGGYGGPRGEFRGGRRDDFNNGDADGEHPRRPFERRSGTGRGNEFKREGAGRGNWGTPADEFAPENEEPVNEGEKVVDAEKLAGQTDAEDASKDTPVAETQEKEPEKKEMTLEEYEKLLEEKRKDLLALKPEERKVNLDEAFESMQLLSNKKNDDEVFVKLGTEKDKRKEPVEKAKKTKQSINEFLKPADGEGYHRPGGRGRGGRGGRGRGGFGGNNSVEGAAFRSNRNSVEASIPIEDVGQFPSLGAK